MVFTFQLASFLTDEILQYLRKHVNLDLEREIFGKLEFEKKKIQPSDLKPGDHIYVPGAIEDSSKASGQSLIDRALCAAANNGLAFFHHHAVYLGLDEQGDAIVTDFGSKSKAYPVIRKLTDFLGPNGAEKLRRRKYLSSELNHPLKTIHLAKKICRTKKWQSYSLFSNNCEHFATFLKTGLTHSYQIRKLVKKIINGSMLVVKCVSLALKAWKMVPLKLDWLRKLSLPW